MTLKALILSHNSKQVWEEAADRVLRSAKELQELISYFESTDIRLVQRATQIIGKVHDKDRAILKPYLIQMIKGLGDERIDAYKRNVLRIFQTAEIPEQYEGHLFDHAFTFLEDNTEPVAIRAFAMTVCRKIAEKHPELANEVTDAIKLILEENESAGIQNRGGHELRRLKRLIG
ncbi:MAG: hypothetical protein R3279_04510 [Putridiphycobacter sp.]|nr:hypothetical protein [Putridiphycobacter sp.]